MSIYYRCSRPGTKESIYTATQCFHSVVEEATFLIDIKPSPALVRSPRLWYASLSAQMGDGLGCWRKCVQILLPSAAPVIYPSWGAKRPLHRRLLRIS